MALVGTSRSCSFTSSQGRSRLMPVPYPGGGGYGGGFGGIGGLPLFGGYGKKKRAVGKHGAHEQFQLVETEYACVNACMKEVETQKTAPDGMNIFDQCERLCSSTEKMWTSGLR